MEEDANHTTMRNFASPKPHGWKVRSPSRWRYRRIAARPLWTGKLLRFDRFSINLDLDLLAHHHRASL